MFAIVDGTKLIGIYETYEHAAEQKQALGLVGEIKPATFGDDAGRIKLQVRYTLEKFDGDIQSPETLREVIEGDG